MLEVPEADLPSTSQLPTRICKLPAILREELDLKGGYITDNM